MNVYVAKSHLVVVHLPGDVLQGVQDRVELVDDELGSCEEEGNQEDEQVCHQLLQVHPLPLVREVLPDYIIWRWGVPVKHISKMFVHRSVYQTLHLSGLMATFD